MIGTATPRQVARGAVVSVVVALILALLPALAGGRGDAHGYVYDGGGRTPVLSVDAAPPAVDDLGKRLNRSPSGDTSTGYDSAPNLPHASARPGGRGLAPQTAGAGVRRPGPGTPHIDDFAEEAIPGFPFRGRNAPADAFAHLKKHHGLDPHMASNRLHVLKQQGGLGAADDVVIGRTGDVYNAQTGERLGTLTDPNLGTTR